MSIVDVGGRPPSVHPARVTHPTPVPLDAGALILGSVTSPPEKPLARKRSKSKARKKKTPEEQASGGPVSASSDEASATEEVKSAEGEQAEPKKSRKKKKKKKAVGKKKAAGSDDAAATPDVIDLTLDEDFDDEAERARLIAEAAALSGGDAAATDQAAASLVGAEEAAALSGGAAKAAALAAALEAGDEPVTEEGPEDASADEADPPGAPTEAIEEGEAAIAADDEAEAVVEAPTEGGAAGITAAADAADEAATGETAAADAAYATVVAARTEGAPRVPNPDIPTLTPAALAALTAIHREGMATLPGELVLDLGEGTTEEERDRLLAAALAHVEMQDAIYRVPSDSGAGRRWKGTIASSLFLLAALVVLVPPPAILPAPAATLSSADHLHGLRVSLLLQSQQIEAFRTREGRLPDSLDEVATALPGIRFVKSNNRLYQLVAYTPAGDAIVYDSASPEPEFQALAATWASTDTSS
jgi:hypothetical protein